jgi:hypothetical protein
MRLEIIDGKIHEQVYIPITDERLLELLNNANTLPFVGRISIAEVRHIDIVCRTPIVLERFISTSLGDISHLNPKHPVIREHKDGTYEWVAGPCDPIEFEHQLFLNASKPVIDTFISVKQGDRLFYGKVKENIRYIYYDMANVSRSYPYLFMYGNRKYYYNGDINDVLEDGDYMQSLHYHYHTVSKHYTITPFDYWSLNDNAYKYLGTVDVKGLISCKSRMTKEELLAIVPDAIV